MKLYPPKKLTFWIALIVALIVIAITVIPGLDGVLFFGWIAKNAFWLLTGAFALLTLSNLIKGL